MTDTLPRAWYVGEAPSECIARARRRLALKLDGELGTPLRSIDFGLRENAGSPWYALRDANSGRPAGEASSWTTIDRHDPVSAYLVVCLWSGTCLESITFRGAPRDMQLYLRGVQVARMHEMELPRQPKWWRRWFCPRRRWDVFLKDELFGSIDLQYPVDKKSRLHLQLRDGTTLPIGVASRWFQAGTALVIPPDAPTAFVASGELELVYFLIAVAFRTLILDLDFCNA